MTATDIHSRRAELLSSLEEDSRFYRLFDHVPGLSFFAKDRDGVLLAANAHLVALYGFDSESDLIGRTDFELLPRRLAEKYRRDDLAIMESRVPVKNLVEIFLNRQGIPSWFVTTKAPLISPVGDVLGVMGIIQDYQGYRRKNPVDRGLDKAMDHITRNYRAKISISALAKMSGMSLRQFERRFKSYFNLSPQQFVIKMRIHESCELLRGTGKPVGEIALDLGFYDQSSFTVQFKRAMGLTPLQYRKQFI
ncbi:MAG: helix-turn-helix domain-containing protein [Verrucomicrobiales bacterium]